MDPATDRRDLLLSEAHDRDQRARALSVEPLEGDWVDVVTF